MGFGVFEILWKVFLVELDGEEVNLMMVEVIMGRKLYVWFYCVRNEMFYFIII